MKAPPSDPGSTPDPRPLGSTFWILFFAPIAIFLVALVILDLMLIAGVFAVASSIACATMVVDRSGGLAGFLTFCGLVFIYAAIAVVGCRSVFRF